MHTYIGKVCERLAVKNSIKNNPKTIGFNYS